MFEQLFTQPATIAHHHSSPYATERRQYLSLLMEDGRSRNSLRVIAELLISHAKHLPLHRADAPALALKVGQDPPSLALLDGLDVELGQLVAPQGAADQKRQDHVGVWQRFRIMRRAA